MRTGPNGGRGSSERWNKIFEILSAKPRRMVLFSVMNKPPGRPLPLPEAAETSTQSMDSEELAIKLRHVHLPILDEMGYVTWGEEPFRVKRGPNFEEPAFILGLVNDSIDDIPQGLVDSCRRIAEMADDGGS